DSRACAPRQAVTSPSATHSDQPRSGAMTPARMICGITATGTSATATSSVFADAGGVPVQVRRPDVRGLAQRLPLAVAVAVRDSGGSSGESLPPHRVTTGGEETRWRDGPVTPHQ